MAISIDWGTKVINIPQSYLTNITGTLYELDTETFREDLKSLEDDEAGMPFPDTHQHYTEVEVVGVTYARFIIIINGYSITFEDGQYSVRLAGSNNNFFDVENGVLNQNQVQVIPGNSAGLIKVTSGSGVTEQDKTDIIEGVWDEAKGSHVSADTFGKAVNDMETDLNTPSQYKADVSALALEASVQSVKSKTDNLPASPAPANEYDAVLVSIGSDVDALPTLAEIEASNVLAKQAELLRAVGLVQENYYLDQAVYDSYQGQKLLTSGRIRIYSVAGSVGTSNNVLATYLITATWSDNELQTYSVVKQ